MSPNRDPEVAAAIVLMEAAAGNPDANTIDVGDFVKVGGVMTLKLMVRCMEAIGVPAAKIAALLNEATNELTPPEQRQAANPEPDEPTLAIALEPTPEPTTDKRMIPVGDGLEILDAEPANEPDTEPAIAADALAGPTTDIAHSDAWLERRENPDPAPAENGNDHGPL